MKTIGSWVILPVVCGAVVMAQDSKLDSKLQFEVASVRVSGPVPQGTPLRGGMARGGPSTSDPERITYERALFRQLLMDAYGVQRDQIKGPEWATADVNERGALFDISAKVPPGTTKAQAATMLQNLLAERFQLTLHHETAQFSGFTLVVAKGGSKLKESGGASGRIRTQCHLCRCGESPN